MSHRRTSPFARVAPCRPRAAGPRPAAPRRRRLALAALIGGLLATPAAWAIDPAERDPAKIMAAVEDRDQGDKMTAAMQMTITDAAGRARTRVVRSRSMKAPGGRKQLMIFESPADVRNTALLTFDWDDGAKDDDQWLYLPSLRKATRISSGDKAGAFMGSDFSYADMTRKDPKNYDYTLIKPEVVVDGEPCWLIEARPKTDKERKETGYLKSMIWISKAKLIPLQSKVWVIEGKRIKQIKTSAIKRVEGVWVPHQMAVRTLRGGAVESTTVLRFSAVKLNDPAVKPADFTQRRLEQGL
jgi:outer membrane lipoprotein-sorting protein